nr:hypothetical protein [Marinitoga lauensis]
MKVEKVVKEPIKPVAKNNIKLLGNSNLYIPKDIKKLKTKAPKIFTNRVPYGILPREKENLYILILSILKWHPENHQGLCILKS